MYPIPIQTKFGERQFDIINRQYHYYKKSGFLPEFVARCKVDSETQNAYLKFFLNDWDMGVKYKLHDEDSEGWNIFQRQNDMCGILKYFSERSS